MTPEQVSENLAKIGAEKVTEIVLVAERTDQLVIDGQQLLLKDQDLFKWLLTHGELRKSATDDISLAVDRIQREIDRSEKVRADCRADLKRKFPETASRVYTHTDDTEAIDHPSKLDKWSVMKMPLESRLIDADDKYEHPTQIPALYPGLQNEASFEEWWTRRQSPSHPLNVAEERRKEEARGEEARGEEAREEEARGKKALGKYKQVPNEPWRSSNDVTDPRKDGVLTPPFTPAKHKSTSEDSASPTKKARSGTVQDDKNEATSDVKSP